MTDETPVSLAKQLGVSDKAIRAWLRRERPRPEVEKGTRWVLSQADVSAVRDRFSWVDLTTH